MLSTLEKQHKGLLQSLAVHQQQETTADNIEQNEKLIEALTSSVAKLSVVQAQKKAETERVQSTLRERRSSLMVSLSVKRSSQLILPVPNRTCRQSCGNKPELPKG